MTQRTFVGNTGDWFTAGEWTPTGTPVAGDTLIIGSGDAEISAADFSANGTLDSETVLLGSTLAGSPATLTADDGLFGTAFLIDITGTIDQAVLDFDGATSFAGTIVSSGTGGATDLQIGAIGSLQDFVLQGGAMTISAGDDFIVSGGTFTDDGMITVTGGTMVVSSDTTLSGTGTILVEYGGTLIVDGSVGSGVTLDYLGTGGATAAGAIFVGDPVAFHATVENLIKPDVLDLVGVNGHLAEYNTATGQLIILQSETDTGQVADFTLFGNFSSTGLYVGPDGNGGSRISQVIDRTWTGSSGDWYTASLWSSPHQFINTFPSFGDSATIEAGTVSLTAADLSTFGSLDNVDIDIGGSADGGTIVMAVTSEIFGADLDIETAGTAVAFVLEASGTTTSSAQIGADGAQGITTIDVTGVGSDFINAAVGQLEVDSESGLVLAGGEITNLGLIVDDQSTLTLGAGATIGGSGAIDVQDGGTLVVDGTVAAGQIIAMSGSSAIVLAPGGSIAATINGFLQGETIELAGQIANFASFDTSSEVLTIRDGGSAGSVVATFQMGQEYGTADFSVASDGAGDSVITDSAAAPTVISEVLPVELALTAGATMSLASILEEAFGTAAPPFASYNIISSSLSDLYNDRFSFWNPSDPSVTGWLLNGAPVTPDTVTPVSAADVADVELVAGDDIKGDATIQVPVAFSDGTPTEYVDYLVRLYDPSVITPVTSGGAPTAADEVATAEEYGTVYNAVANTNDCYNIAGDIAGAAGAPIFDYGSTIPTANASTGYWRQIYIGSDSYSPAITNWATLVQPGDIVRVMWDGGGQHSTTVLSAATLDSNNVWQFKVVDNDDNEPGYEAIGIHSATYEQGTVPKSISIFRLDPDGEYLITGGSIGGALIQGSTNDNLILPQAAGDTIYAGAGDDIIAGEAAILNGTTIADFHAGDTIDNTNMGADDRHVTYDALNGVLTLSSSVGSLTLDLPVGLTGTFSITTDGGTLSGPIADGGLVPPGVSPRALDGGDLGTLYTALGTLTGADIVYTACYVRGTRIATPRGDVAIERLAIGDFVRTASGEVRRIRWIGRRSYDGRFIAGDRNILPVRIRAGALADGVPRRDLLVSPKHAMWLDGVLIPAELLVNGRTIVSVRAVKEVTYLHLELDSHDVLLAEGAASESFVDCDSRMMFQNAAEYAVLYPRDDRAGWQFCAPRVEEGEVLARVRRNLASRAGLSADHMADAAMPGPLHGRVDDVDFAAVSGWAFDPGRPNTPVRLAVLVDGVVVAETVANLRRPDLGGRRGFVHRFVPALGAGSDHVIVVRRMEDGAEVDVPQVLFAPGPLEGRVEVCRAGVVAGWAVDVEAPGVPVRLEVLADGVVVGRTVASRYRADLARAGKAGGSCHFRMVLPDGVRDAVIQVRRVADEAELSGAA